MTSSNSEIPESKRVRVTLRLESSIFNQINSHSNNISEYIRDAIKCKLDNPSSDVKNVHNKCEQIMHTNSNISEKEKRRCL